MSGSKITRDISTQLFKYVKRIDITFNPFDSRTKSARELMRQVQADRIQQANPKMALNCNIIGSAAPPSVVFEFVDGDKKNFESSEFLVNEMLSEVYVTANNLDIEYELEGKSIEDK